MPFRSPLLPAATFALAAMCWAVPCDAQSGPGSAAQELRSINGTVEFRRSIKLPAEAEGKLTEVMFEEGSSIEVDQVIANIDSTAATLAVEMKAAEEKEALLNAANDVNIRDAVESEKLAIAEAKSAVQLYNRNIVPLFEKEKKELEAGRATLRIGLAEMNMKIEQAKLLVKRAEIKMANYEVAKRQIRAPFAGVIEEKKVEQGEWVQPGTPIATLVQMSKMKVKGDIEALGNNSRLYAGAPCVVEVNVGQVGDAPYRVESTLAFVSAGINSLRSYTVWVEIDNKQVDGRWLVKPGMDATIIVK